MSTPTSRPTATRSFTIPRRRLALIVLFVLTRIVLAVAADGNTGYPSARLDNDVTLYEADARAVQRGGVPYTDVHFEYPPGALPTILAPLLGEPASYRTAFVTVAMMVDAVIFVGLLLVAQGRRRYAGAWIWVICVPLLGPIVYLRYDLVPAALTVFALERLAKDRDGSAGSALAFGAITKVFPGLLALPILAATRSLRLTLGFVNATVFGLAVFAAFAGAGALGDMTEDVVGYHGDRGIQVESVWGTGLLIAGRFGADVSVTYSFLAHHLAGPLADRVASAGTAVAVLALLVGGWLGRRAGGAASPGPAAAMAAFATLALLLAAGTVYSTQYSLWLISVGAVLGSFAPRTFRGPLALLVPIALLSHLGYPWLYTRLVHSDGAALATVSARNLLVVATAVWTARTILRLPRRDGASGSVVWELP